MSKPTKIKSIAFLVVASITLMILKGCTGYEPSVRLKNVASIYNPSATTMYPQFILYHTDDSTSMVYFRINTEDLKFNSANEEQSPKAKFQIQYRLYNSFQNISYADSATLVYDIIKSSSSTYFQSNFPIKMPAGKVFSLEIVSTDLLRYSNHLSYFTVDKRNKISTQNFLLRSVNGNPLFSNYLFPDTRFTIENNRMEFDSLLVEKYEKPMNSPNPPFAMSKQKTEVMKPDTSWYLKYNKRSQYSLNGEGIYFFKADERQQFGLTIFQFGKYFPETKTAESLLGPLKFLTNNKEYRKLLSIDNHKNAIDSFWLATSGNMNRTKELIRIYYSRVFFANLYFTHQTEGWQTDRGMIYVIFGPPKTIYKSDNAERWVYGDNKNLLSMDFYFDRKFSPFSDNNFILSRQEVYKSSWYQAVETWRSGRVYSVKN